MKKWEYLTVFIAHGSDGSVSVAGWRTYSEGLDGILDDIGSCGWELVCIQMDCYTFKRELAE